MAFAIASPWLFGCSEPETSFHLPTSTRLPDAGPDPRSEAQPEAGGDAPGPVHPKPTPPTDCDFFDDFDDDELDADAWGTSGGGTYVVSETDGSVLFGATGNRSHGYIVDRRIRSRATPTEISFTVTRFVDADAIAGFRAILFSSAQADEDPYQLAGWEFNWFAADYSGHHADLFKMEVIGYTDRWTDDVPFEANVPYRLHITYDQTTTTFGVDGETILVTDEPIGARVGYHHFGFWDFTGTIDDFCYREL